ncbi:MAG: sulfotransferase family protein, partial [Stellaceae bacterium]
FALGKALGDIGRDEGSFAHFLAGNARRRAKTDYDEARALRGLARLRGAMGAESLRRWPTGSDSESPIFIVGMPRSGSTLAEQILAAHPAVACAGETDALSDALKSLRRSSTAWRYPRPAFVPSKAQLAELAERYLALLAEAAGPEVDGGAPERITDKMLANFRHVGLITRLFPKARILHTFRDPVETCLSCFAIDFASQPFSFDLAELGRFYRAYAATMRHWKATLPQGAFLDIRYEAVVEDFEASARAILDWCGLPWRDECLRFFEVDRPVRTSSVEQVRRPIYRSSLRRWRPDPETLRPLLEGLGLSSAPQ